MDPNGTPQPWLLSFEINTWDHFDKPEDSKETSWQKSNDARIGWDTPSPDGSFSVFKRRLRTKVRSSLQRF